MDIDFRTLRTLVGAYLAVSVLTLAAVWLMRDSHYVNSAVWVRTTIVTVSALLLTLFAARAARGHERMLLRVRLLSGIMVVAIVVVIAIPGDFPLWLKVEQGVCGVLLIGVTTIAGRIAGRMAGWRKAHVTGS